MPSFGGILYVVLLFINSMAVLSEDRFLARIGWSTVPTPNNPTVGFQQPYDQYGGGAGGVQDIGVKGRLINLIGAVRTLMRSMYNPIVSYSYTRKRANGTLNTKPYLYVNPPSYTHLATPPRHLRSNMLQYGTIYGTKIVPLIAFNLVVIGYELILG